MSVIVLIVPSEPKFQFFTRVNPVPNVVDVGPGPTAGLDRLPPPTVSACCCGGWEVDRDDADAGGAAGPVLAGGATDADDDADPDADADADEPGADGPLGVALGVAPGVALPIRRHRWLVPPWQRHSWTFEPAAVAAALTSRQRCDWTPRMVPSAWTVHRWLSRPWQGYVITMVPLVVAPPLASRHDSPTLIWPPPVMVHCCPAQSWMVALVALSGGAVRQRPEPTPRM